MFAFSLRKKGKNMGKTSRAKVLSWRRLLKDLFVSNKTKKPRKYPLVSNYSIRKFPAHNMFLTQKSRSIKVFADIGCAFSAGAPRTIDAKNALGKKSCVYAVDIQSLEAKTKKDLENGGIKPLIHSIAEKPLPFECDAIRFANVSFLMTQSDRRRAIVNIWHSLRENGYLLGEIPKFGKGKNVEFVLRKKGRGFELVEPKDMSEIPQ